MRALTGLPAETVTQEAPSGLSQCSKLIQILKRTCLENGEPLVLVRIQDLLLLCAVRQV